MTIFTRIKNKVLDYLRHRPVLNKARSHTESVILTTKPKKLLILCYGNIYRSPFVADYLSKKLADKVTIRSAGTYPKSGRHSPDEHIIMSRAFGVELASHRSTVADKPLLDWADWIIIMDRRNWDELEIYGDIIRKKIIWLGTFTGESGVEIQDPYGKCKHEIEIILRQLQACSNKLIEYI